jgi:uncharacterized tellurite resistance protein B-like protein
MQVLFTSRAHEAETSRELAVRRASLRLGRTGPFPPPPEIFMRTYPIDSPQAAARIVALTLVADGHVSRTELDVLERTGALEQLGLDRHQMQSVLQGLCEDLLDSRHPQWTQACQLDSRTLSQLMAEIEAPALRAVVLRLCVAVAEADGDVADGESMVLVNAVEQWGLQHEMLIAPPLDGLR